jgi:hypothetical protein
MDATIKLSDGIDAHFLDDFMPLGQMGFPSERLDTMPCRKTKPTTFILA